MTDEPTNVSILQTAKKRHMISVYHIRRWKESRTPFHTSTN